MEIPLKYTDPTGYQTQAAPGAISWLGGGGGRGESGMGFGGSVNWNYFVPNTSWHQYYGNYAYDTYNWSTGYYEHHTLEGVGTISYDQAMHEYILPNSVTYNLNISKSVPTTQQSTKASKKTKSGGLLTQPYFFSKLDDVLAFIWESSFDANNNPIAETGAWWIDLGNDKQGFVVLPNDINDLTHCFSNNYFPVRSATSGQQVLIDSEWYNILSFIHTHPSYNGGDIGISNGDIRMVNFIGGPIYILWNRRMWEVVSTKNYKDIGGW